MNTGSQPGLLHPKLGSPDQSQVAQIKYLLGLVAILCMDILPWHRGTAVLHLPLQPNFGFEVQFEFNECPTYVQNHSKQVMREENHQKCIILFPVANMEIQVACGNF